MVNFVKIVDRIREIEKLAREKDVAELFEISPPDFSKRKKSGTLLPFIINWGIAKKVNLNWLITGRGEKYAVEASKPPESTIFDKSISDMSVLDLIQTMANKLSAKDEEINNLKDYIDKIQNVIKDNIPPDKLPERRDCCIKCREIIDINDHR